MYAKPKTVNIFYRFETTQFNSTLESAVDQLTINLKILKNITTTTKQINTYNKFVTISTKCHEILFRDLNKSVRLNCSLLYLKKMTVTFPRPCAQFIFEALRIRQTKLSR